VFFCIEKEVLTLFGGFGRFSEVLGIVFGWFLVFLGFSARSSLKGVFGGFRGGSF